MSGQKIFILLKMGLHVINLYSLVMCMRICILNDVEKKCIFEEQVVLIDFISKHTCIYVYVHIKINKSICKGPII